MTILFYINLFSIISYSEVFIIRFARCNRKCSLEILFVQFECEVIWAQMPKSIYSFIRAVSSVCQWWWWWLFTGKNRTIAFCNHLKSVCFRYRAFRLCVTISWWYKAKKKPATTRKWDKREHFGKCPLNLYRICRDNGWLVFVYRLMKLLMM